jgi:phosphatidylglycerophosphatase GEP4
MALSRFSIKQAINLPGIKKAMQSILKPSLMMPQINVKQIKDLKFQTMKDNGIKCIVFDKDNTLRWVWLTLDKD